MEYLYYTCDVFTKIPFAGNQLAVFPEAEGLTGIQMQQIAREFNFSETSFVFPPEKGQTRKVRIFTTTHEVPFAGHPNIGTAFVLKKVGLLESIDSSRKIVFEEEAGFVYISSYQDMDGHIFFELTAPQNLKIGSKFSSDLLTSAMGLAKEDIKTSNHLPLEASVGLPFIFVEISSSKALEKVNFKSHLLDTLNQENFPKFFHLYTKTRDEYDVRARMFSLFERVDEDPATGSANCALAGLLSYLDNKKDSVTSLQIAQGVEMGRPSILYARAVKKNRKILSTYVGGFCVLVGEGKLVVT